MRKRFKSIQIKVLRVVLFIVLIVISVFNNIYAFEPVKKMPACETCSLNTSGGSVLQWQNQTVGNSINIILVCFIISIATFYLWHTYKKMYYPIIGCVLVVLVLGSSYINMSNTSGMQSEICAQEKAELNKPPTIGFQKPWNEFASASTQSDEFAPMNSADTAGGEFAPIASEFSEQKPTTVVTEIIVLPDWGMFYQIIVLLSLGVVISLLLKYSWLQNFRGFTLLLSVVYLGFYKGGCPCMIMSFQNTLLFILGNPVSWVAMFWFLGLIPLTYFFGKVWCGWLCHLGALQEFIFRPQTKKMIASPKLQKVLKTLQIILFGALIVQVIITRSNLYVHIDPFKVAFNLVSANLTGYILLVILLLSSLFIQRPFCRAFCPVGLVLGWVSKIPGAHTIKVDKQNCSSCKRCTAACKHGAINHKKNGIYVSSEDCIACGECLHVCKPNALKA